MSKRKATATYHSIVRNKQRFGVHGSVRSRNQLSTEIRDAYGADRFDGRERRWLLSREWDGCRAMVYHQKCLIVSEDDRIVTVYTIPDWFMSRPLHTGKTRYRKLGYLREHLNDMELAA